jgi:hypothetical protein
MPDSEPEPSHDAEPEQEAKGTDAEGEQQMQALPPLEEKEEPNVAADASDNTAGNGQDLGRCNPEHLRQFEALFGGRVFFGPDVPGASMGVLGPNE